jgi:hypothetical protein
MNRKVSTLLAAGTMLAFAVPAHATIYTLLANLDSSQETINFWIVDKSSCAGGPVVYTLTLGNGVVLSMFGFGPLDLGRRLINAIYT